MADIKEYAVVGGNVIDSKGNVKNVADILGAEPVDYGKKYNIEDYSAVSGIMLNSEGKACDVVSALEKLAAGGGSEGGDITEVEERVNTLEKCKQDKAVVVSVTSTTINADPDKIYIFNKENSISELNITLTNIKEDTDNEFVIKFISAIEDMPITITDNGGNSNVLWHNEPKILAGKAYTLCINIVGEYKEAVLSYAE